jgi:hypothetical protein
VTATAMSPHKLPGVAEVAMQSGLYTGHRLKRLIEGKESAKPFKYHDLGSAAYISRGRAVVSAGPAKLSAFPGWVVWLFIHIAFLTGYRNRIGAVLTWFLAFTRDSRRERTYTTRATDATTQARHPPPWHLTNAGLRRAETDLMAARDLADAAWQVRTARQCSPGAPAQAWPNPEHCATGSRG